MTTQPEKTVTRRSKAKGTILVYDRLVVSEQAHEFQQAFLNRLSEEETHYYHTAMPVTWIPIDVVDHINETLVSLLYPDDPQGQEKLGQAEANHDYSGIYRFLLRFATVTFIMQQSARLWRTYHDTGEAECVSVGEKRIHFVIYHYPHLPEGFRKHLVGDIRGIIGFTQLKDVCITPDFSNPQAWTYEITWK